MKLRYKFSVGVDSNIRYLCEDSPPRFAHTNICSSADEDINYSKQSWMLLMDPYKQLCHTEFEQSLSSVPEFLFMAS